MAGPIPLLPAETQAEAALDKIIEIAKDVRETAAADEVAKTPIDEIAPPVVPPALPAFCVETANAGAWTNVWNDKGVGTCFETHAKAQKALAGHWALLKIGGMAYRTEDYRIVEVTS